MECQQGFHHCSIYHQVPEECSFNTGIVWSGCVGGNVPQVRLNSDFLSQKKKDGTSNSSILKRRVIFFVDYIFFDFGNYIVFEEDLFRTHFEKETHLPNLHLFSAVLVSGGVVKSLWLDCLTGFLYRTQTSG